MSDAALGELMAVVALFSQTNRLAEGYQVEPDAMFMQPPAQGAGCSG